MSLLVPLEVYDGLLLSVLIEDGEEGTATIASNSSFALYTTSEMWCLHVQASRVKGEPYIVSILEYAEYVHVPPFRRTVYPRTSWTRVLERRRH